MATQLDYYRILQVHPRAEKEVIEAAYRKLAAKYHPDVSQVSDTTERMKQINTAYEVLSDPVKRAAYDAATGVVPPPGAPPHAEARPRYASKARRLMIAAGLIVLTLVASRLSPKLALLLVVFSLVVWLLFTLAKPRG